MDHIKIVKRAFSIVSRNRYLWLLGFLGGSSYTGWSFYKFSAPNFDNIKPFKFDVPKDSTISSASTNLHDFGKVLGESISSQYSISPVTWIIVSVITLIVIILAVYLSIVARGAIVKSAFVLDDDKRYSLKDAWYFGNRYFWKRLSFTLLIFLISMLAITVTALPIILFAIMGATVLAIISAIIFGIAFLAFITYLGLIIPLAERVLFLKGEKTIKSLFVGAKLFNKNWLDILLIYLILFAIGSVAAIGLVLALLISILIAVALHALLALASPVVATIITTIVAIAILLALFVFAGIKRAFDSVVITIAYKSAHKTA